MVGVAVISMKNPSFVQTNQLHLLCTKLGLKFSSKANTKCNQQSFHNTFVATIRKNTLRFEILGDLGLLCPNDEYVDRCDTGRNERQKTLPIMIIIRECLKMKSIEKRL